MPHPGVGYGRGQVGEGGMGEDEEKGEEEERKEEEEEEESSGLISSAGRFQPGLL